jgi:hypothetical protein
MAVLRITYIDPRFDEMCEEERTLTIEDLFAKGELRLDTDKRVKLLSVVQICEGNLQGEKSDDFSAILDKIVHALLSYEEHKKYDK